MSSGAWGTSRLQEVLQRQLDLAQRPHLSALALPGRSRIARHRTQGPCVDHQPVAALDPQAQPWLAQQLLAVLGVARTRAALVAGDAVEQLLLAQGPERHDVDAPEEV